MIGPVFNLPVSKEYIERGAVLAKGVPIDGCFSNMISAFDVANIPAADVVEVVGGYSVGDFCIYGFADENKSLAIVEIVKILDDTRGVAEIKFHKVVFDDTGNGLFEYLLRSGKTMNGSFKYLKNITPKAEREDGGADNG